MPPPSLKPRIEALELEIIKLKKDLEQMKLRPEIALAGLLKAPTIEAKPVAPSVQTIAEAMAAPQEQAVYTPPANIPQAIPNSTLTNQGTPMPDGKPKERSMGCMVFEPAPAS